MEIRKIHEIDALPAARWSGQKLLLRLAQGVFAAFCLETIFALPFRSLQLAGRSDRIAVIVALGVVLFASLLFALRNKILPLLSRCLRLPDVGEKVWLLSMLTVGLAMRLAWALSFPVTLKSDHLAYFQIAAQMAQGHLGPGAYWPPGFSLALTPFFMVLGAQLWVAKACGLLFFVVTCLLTHALAMRLQGIQTARIATLLVAVWPGYFTLAGINCKEVFLAMLLPAAIFFYCKTSAGFAAANRDGLPAGSKEEKYRWGYTIAAGLCMGLASLTQPGYMLFPAVILLAELLRGVGLVRAAWRTSLFSMALLAAILPWTYRNYLVCQHVVLISTNGGSVFYRANNANANPNYNAEGEVALPKDEFEADRVGYQMAKAWIRQHPADFAVLMFRKQLVFLGDDALGAYETLKRDQNPSVLLYSSVKGICNLFWLAIWTGLLLGLPLLFRQKKWQIWFGLLFLPLLYQWAIDSVFESGPRHHIPYLALMAVMAGMVWNEAVRQSGKVSA